MTQPKRNPGRDDRKKNADFGPTPQRLLNIPAPRLISAALLLMTFVVFFQVRGHDFVEIDDEMYVTRNPLVKDGFTLDHIGRAFTAGYETNWFPLTWMSHMLDAEIYGMNPRGHHLTSLWIHMANVLLLFFALRRLTARLDGANLWPAAFAAALFAIHPLAAESVAWVAERKNVLSTFFWFLTMWLYVRYADRPTAGRYAGVFISLALGLMSKPMLVTVPVALLLLDFWPLRRSEPLPRLMLEKIPLLALSAASSLVTILAQKGGGAMASIESMPVSLRLSNALVSYFKYIGKMFWPERLAFFYPHPYEMLPMWQAAASAGAIVLISVFVIFMARRRPYLPVGWFWYLITLLPVIGLVQVGRQAMADRYAYVPLIGLYVIAAWGARDLLAGWRHQKIFFSGAAALILAALMISAHAQVAYWRNSQALYEHAVRVTDDNYLAHYNLANALFNQGRMEEALPHYRETVRIRPAYYPPAHFNLGYILSKLGRTDEAIAQFEEAIKLNPGHQTAHNNLGMTLYQKGRMDEALDQFFEAVKVNPGYEDARNNLANMLSMKARLAEALAQYEEALKINPNSHVTHYNLGNVLARLGKFDAARTHLTEALRLNPGFKPAQESLAQIQLILKR